MNIKRYLSLGAGVQSSALALMIARGIFPPVEAAIFADTMAEPASVYTWLDWLEEQLPYPLIRISRGDLGAAQLTPIARKRDGSLYTRTSIPVFVENGMSTRQCTADYKIIPIHRELKKREKIRRGEKSVRVDILLGISTDEIIRAKSSRHAYARNLYPLIDAGLNRLDCLRWMEANGYPQPPRSACVFCPYKSNAEWLHMKNNEPGEFARAVKFETDLQAVAEKYSKMRRRMWLHRSLKPLDSVDFTEGYENNLNLFGNDCEGICGV